MVTREIAKTKTIARPNRDEKLEIERWFRTDYIERKMRITRYSYLKLPLDETLYALEMEAYDKEQRLRELQGKGLLPDIRIGGIF